MCFDVDSRPPLPPIRGSALDASDVTLTSGDGTRVAAFAARAAQPRGPGMVILPDVRGLHPYYEELALRFAEAGVHAIAIDLYSRSAGTGKRGEGFEYEPHVAQLRIETVNADVAAAVEHLRGGDGGEAARVFTVGFCLGGRVSLLQPAAGIGLSGAIGFYAWPVGPHRSGIPAPADVASQLESPLLLIYGGADRGIPAEARDEFEQALNEAGVEHRAVVYADAPHSFFDRKATEFADASASAWREMLDFIGAPERGR